jgi:hypothetical protein
MNRSGIKNGLRVVLKLLLILSLSIGFSCDFDFGGTPIGDTGDDDDECTVGGLERVSIASNGSQANGDSEDPSISSDGRFIAFISNASNLVSGDSNGVEDIFVHDRDTGITERVSVASNGTEADDASFTLSLSADGSFVAFGSYATNLVGGDTNGVIDVFVHNRNSGVTERVSVASNGTQANDASFYVAISAAGRFVAFMSEATNLVPGDTNSVSDIFVYDRNNSTTERVSVDSPGNEANAESFFAAISSDGQIVAFSSAASNLVVNDTNNQVDIFVHDRQTGTTELVTGPAEFDIGSGIIIVEAVISPDGSFVGFRSNADDLVPGDTNNSFDTFVIERDTAMIERSSVSSSEVQGNSDSGNPSLSSGNRFVVFSSLATNLVSQDTNGFEDVFVRDRDDGLTKRISLALDCSEGDNGSFSGVVSGDGQFVAFTSAAANLISGDTNGAFDVFVRPNPLSP